MKQIVQNLKSGETALIESPLPRLLPGYVLIRTERSVVSAGTERMLVEFGRANLIEKARQQPEKVGMVWNRLMTEGIFSTIEAVRSKLDQPIPLGYCNAGRVIAVGQGVTSLAVGDRVASNGYHAEIVRVPTNLCAKIPASVSDDEAAFTALGSIALQGLRLAQPTLGETFVVMGLGLIGLLSVQLLIANGCKVLGVDPNVDRLRLAESLGATAIGKAPTLHDEVLHLTNGQGADGVIIAASAKSSEPIQQAARMCRKRGRLVLVGVTGLELSRADFYEKELTFQVSCSYGPGRYDPEYEDRGVDYPVGYVRWTEQRNFEAVLQLVAAGRLKTHGLITHRFGIDQAQSAYDVLAKDKSALAIMLTYDLPGTELTDRVAPITTTIPRAESTQVRAAFIGAGNYASRVLMPSFKAAGIGLHTLVTTGSVQGTYASRKFGFSCVSSDERAAIENQDVDLVVVATRHDSHADLASKALKAGKHVFLEKPAAITLDQVESLAEALQAAAALGGSAPTLTVGFNRRFAPLVRLVRARLAEMAGPKSFTYTVNAGVIPSEHWTQDPEIGGGRVIGEVCHFIDLLRFLADAPIKRVEALAMRPPGGQPLPDTVAISICFENGSLGAIQYYANGSPRFPKERLEVFCSGAVMRIDNFRKLESFGRSGVRNRRLWKIDKGQAAMAVALNDALLSGGGPLIPAVEILEVARAAIQCTQEIGFA